MPALISQGKHYPWPRPQRCPRCGGLRLWGHGYVGRYFNPFSEPVWIKRWRCAECGSVHTLRPDTHWRRFWTALRQIVACLETKLEGGRWRKGVSRQSQQYWLRGYQKQSLLGGNPAADLATMISNGVMAATHSLTDRAVIPWPLPPHPSLAATGPPVPP